MLWKIPNGGWKYYRLLYTIFYSTFCYISNNEYVEYIYLLSLYLAGTLRYYYSTEVLILFFNQYIILLLIAFLFELLVGALAYIYEQNVLEDLNMTLSNTFMHKYAVSESHTEVIDRLQQNNYCCGAVRFEEYKQSVWLKSNRMDLIRPREGRIVPDSCCVSMTTGCGTSDHPSNIPYTGCKKLVIN